MATASSGSRPSRRTTATRHVPGAPDRSGAGSRSASSSAASSVIPIPARSAHAPASRPAAASRSAPTVARRRSARSSTPTACRRPACSRDPPSAFWMPVGVGRTTMGAAISSRPPPARKPARPTAHAAGRTSVTTTEPRATVDQGRRTAGEGAADRGATAAGFMAGGSARATPSAVRAPRAPPGPCPSPRRTWRSRRSAARSARARSASWRSRRARPRPSAGRRPEAGSGPVSRSARASGSPPGTSWDPASATVPARAMGPVLPALGREQLVQRLRQRSAPDDGGRARDDDPLELRERRRRGLEVDRLQVDQRVADRHHEQVAADHAAATLVPEGDLRRDRRGPGRSGPRSAPARRSSCPTGTGRRGPARSSARRCGRPPTRSCSAAAARSSAGAAGTRPSARRASA